MVGIAVSLFIASEILRFLISTGTALIGKLSMKEAVFVGLSWIPKGALTNVTAFAL